MPALRVARDQGRRVLDVVVDATRGARGRLIVKNGIILADYADIAAARGVDRNEALVEAGTVRLRPILMTTLCTLFGLAPLALGLGPGAEMQKPLAIAVIGGLTVSTIITLLFVPTALALVRHKPLVAGEGPGET